MLISFPLCPTSSPFHLAYAFYFASCKSQHIDQKCTIWLKQKKLKIGDHQFSGKVYKDRKTAVMDKKWGQIYFW